MQDFTILGHDQCRLSKNEKIREAAITDFSILLGGNVDETHHVSGNNSLGGRRGYFWTKSDNGFERYSVYHACGGGKSIEGGQWFKHRITGTRPAYCFKRLRDIPVLREDYRRMASATKPFEIKYGFYPQRAVEETKQIELQKAFESGKLQETGNKYTIDSRFCDEYNKKFERTDICEYMYEGKRYVRVCAKLFRYNKFDDKFRNDVKTLSNGQNYKTGDYVWVEVEPIRWVVDPKEGIMITEKVIFAGVQFEDADKYSEKETFNEKEFRETNMKSFLDKYWARDIEQVREQEKIQGQTQSQSQNQGGNPRRTRLERLNPDTTSASQRRRVSDTEMIQDWIEAGESVLLRGPSGIGKTDRIKQMYPDLIYIKLTNNMFPEKVVGSTNLQTGQNVPPDYAKEAILREATEEERELIEGNIQNLYKLADQIYERSKSSDKKIVILLDELLNVKPAVQSLVYTLVLNRLVETGKGLKLPDNVVLVATGNQRKYSSVAEDLAEPLEKRFSHILDMEPRVGDWLTEYAIPHKVHPSVVGYILSKYNSTGKSERITDMDYFYEEPEVGEEKLDQNGCRGRTNDPRGWVSISDTLYAFEENLRSGKYAGKDVEDILQRSISTKLREEWAFEFFDFYNLPTLTPEEVVQGNYTQNDLPMDINERFAYMTALLSADESQVKQCREFVRKHCDPEYLSIYDIYWAGNDERRMEKIAELESLSMMSRRGHISEEARGYVEDGFEGYERIGNMYRRDRDRAKDESVRGD